MSSWKFLQGNNCIWNSDGGNLYCCWLQECDGHKGIQYDDSAYDVELKIIFGEYFPVFIDYSGVILYLSRTILRKQMKVYIPFRTATLVGKELGKFTRFFQLLFSFRIHDSGRLSWGKIHLISVSVFILGHFALFPGVFFCTQCVWFLLQQF